MQPTVRHILRATRSVFARPSLAYVRGRASRPGADWLISNIISPELRRRPIDFDIQVDGSFNIQGSTRDTIQRIIYITGAWQPAISNYLIRTLAPGDGFVDVGANIGWFSMIAAQHVGTAGSVVAIEASPKIAELCRINLARNGFDGIRLVNAAASDQVGRVSVHLDVAGNLGATSTRHASAEGSILEAVVDCAPLPQLLSHDELRSARVIKVDVEGSEAAVLAGILPSLHFMRHDLEFVLELSPGFAEQHLNILSALESHGFNLYILPKYFYEGGSYFSSSEAAPARSSEFPLEKRDVVFSRIDARFL